LVVVPPTEPDDDLDFDRLLSAESQSAARTPVGRQEPRERPIVDRLCLAIGPVIGAVVGLNASLPAWVWLRLPPGSQLLVGVLLFAIVPLLASAAASERAMPRVIALTNLAMLVGMFGRGLRDAAAGGSLGPHVGALHVIIPIYVAIACVGFIVALATNAILRGVTQRT
jgi:hypothetical protein